MEEAKNQYEEALKASGEACRCGSDTWHDNFAYEESQRQAQLWSRRFNDLLQKRRDSMVVDPPSDCRQVEIGHIVIIEDQSSGEKRTVRIGSHICFRKDEHDITISYAAPLGQLLMGARVGETKSGKLNKGLATFKIVDIKKHE